jgi:protein ImuA
LAWYVPGKHSDNPTVRRIPVVTAPDKLVHGLVWRASELAHARIRALPSGFRELDAELPGSGWPTGMITELIAREPGIGELRLLVPLLRRLGAEKRLVILLAPPHIPYAPALADFGIDPDRLLVIQARHAADRLWAIEQTLRSASFGALLAWIGQERCRPEHLRRLQSAASGTDGPTFLFRDLPARLQPSPAPLRLLLLPRPDQQIELHLLKRRGPVLAKPLLLELPRPLRSTRLKPSQRTRLHQAWAESDAVARPALSRASI